MKRLDYYKREISAELKMLSFNLGYTFTRKIRTIYIGCTDSNNLGDDAVFLALKVMLSKKCFLYKVSYTKPSSGRYFRKVFFKKPDLVLLGGGTLIIKSDTEGFLKLANLFKFKFPKAKIAVLGTGVANPDLAKANGFPTNFLAWKKFLDHSIFTALRGEKSAEILRHRIKSKSEPKIFFDPAIYFSRKQMVKKNKTKSIGINFCNLESRLFGHNKNEVELFFKKLIKLLLDNDWELNFYSTTKSDFFYMKEVLKNENNIEKSLIFHNYQENIEEALKIYESFDLFIGQRLHSIVFAAATYTPFFAIEYESKTSDFLNSLGIYNKSMRTDELNVSIVYNTINSIFDNLECEQNSLYVKSQQAVKLQRECLNSFLEIIDDK